MFECGVSDYRSCHDIDPRSGILCGTSHSAYSLTDLTPGTLQVLSEAL